MTDKTEFMAVGRWPAPHSDYRGAVIIPVDAEGRVLLQLRDRAPGIVHPGEWGLFGGGVEGDESLAEAAAREFEEETGVRRTPSAFRPFARQITPVTRLQLFAFVLEVDFDRRDIRLSEGAGFGFIEPDDFTDMNILAASRIFLEAWRRPRRSP